MAAVDVQGTVILMGAVNWKDGIKLGGTPALLESVELAPLAPVPFPPPSGPIFGACTSGFSSGQTMLLVNPNKMGHNVAGDPIVCMGAMYLQMGPTGNPLPCQPVMGIGTSSVLATLPACKANDIMTFVGGMNFAGAKEK